VYASTTPFCNCLFGKEAITVGSQIENFGNKADPPKSNFSCVASIVTTEPEFISLPVAGKVKTVPNGSTLETSLKIILFWRMSIGFPSKSDAADINFTPSITLPPPTARRKSIFCSRIISTAFINVSKRGLASIPPNSIISKPDNAAVTCS